MGVSVFILIESEENRKENEVYCRDDRIPTVSVCVCVTDTVLIVLIIQVGGKKRLLK